MRKRNAQGGLDVHTLAPRSNHRSLCLRSLYFNAIHCCAYVIRTETIGRASSGRREITHLKEKPVHASFLDNVTCCPDNAYLPDPPAISISGYTLPSRENVSQLPVVGFSTFFADALAQDTWRRWDIDRYIDRVFCNRRFSFDSAILVTNIYNCSNFNEPLIPNVP